MRWSYHAPAAIAAVVCLMGCSRPAQREVDACRQTAIREGVGHQLNGDDVGELTEACMVSKGFSLKEAGKRCPDNLSTATNPSCYYRDNFLGRMRAVFW
jgi:hypothetical protein